MFLGSCRVLVSTVGHGDVGGYKKMSHRVWGQEMTMSWVFGPCGSEMIEGQTPITGSMLGILILFWGMRFLVFIKDYFVLLG